MNSLYLFAVLALLHAVVTPSFGASFRCTLVEVRTLRSDGLLDPQPLSDVLIDDVAVVDRETGAVFHPQFGNETYGEKHILDYGSSHSSFKVIALSPLSPSPTQGEAPYRNTAFLQIETFADGLSKPFIAISGGSIGLGTCK